jgi:hypothetical protein
MAQCHTIADHVQVVIPELPPEALFSAGVLDACQRHLEVCQRSYSEAAHMGLHLFDVSLRIDMMMLMLRQDEEARVRGAVADCLRVLAQRRGTAIFDVMGQQIINSIKAAFVSISFVNILCSPTLLYSTVGTRPCTHTHATCCIAGQRPYCGRERRRQQFISTARLSGAAAAVFVQAAAARAGGVAT